MMTAKCLIVPRLTRVKCTASGASRHLAQMHVPRASQQTGCMCIGGRQEGVIPATSANRLSSASSPENGYAAGAFTISHCRALALRQFPKKRDGRSPHPLFFGVFFTLSLWERAG
jgi:hypothetical protein